MPSDPVSMTYEGFFSRILCGACGEMFEVEVDAQSGEEVRCDLCDTTGEVER